VFGRKIPKRNGSRVYIPLTNHHLRTSCNNGIKTEVTSPPMGEEQFNGDVSFLVSPTPTADVQFVDVMRAWNMRGDRGSTLSKRQKRLFRALPCRSKWRIFSVDQSNVPQIQPVGVDFCGCVLVSRSLCPWSQTILGSAVVCSGW
jgi:hypothetical protein